ncbi:FkbM family methyltransferase [Spirosoma fluminis]
MGRITATVKKLIYASIPAGYKEFIRQEILNEHTYYKYLTTGFSQEGEDQILAQYFYGVDTGFYLDIGAYHPINYSNTYKFYLQGWRGINLDAMPGSMAAFTEIRPRDINVETGLAEQEGTLPYYIFNQTGINTFSETFAAEMVAKGYALVEKKAVKARTLQSVLAEYLPANQVIDFMSLDVEGFELDVLRSNDWSTYRPRLIVVESLQLKNKTLLDNYLGQVNYGLIANTLNNLYYADKR